MFSYYESRLDLNDGKLCRVLLGLAISEIIICYLCYISQLHYIFHVLSQAMADAACPAYMLETRKTAPGLRLLDKWAVGGLDFGLLPCFY